LATELNECTSARCVALVRWWGLTEYLHNEYNASRNNRQLEKVMNATNDLFDRFKKAQGIYADLGGAKALGVKAQTVSNWRNRGSQASPKLIEAMCRHLDEDPARWLLRVMAEQAPDPADGAVWKRLAKQLRIPLTLTGLLITAGLQNLHNCTASVAESLLSLSGDAMTQVGAFVPTVLNVLG
jgi:transcriptional regulator with XRE-family HTH domain